MTRIRARLRILQVETEAQKASLEPEMSRLEIREELCRKLIARAEGGDKQARSSTCGCWRSFFSKTSSPAAAMPPRRARCFATSATILERSLPYDEDRLRARQVQIATAVDMVLQKLPDIQATRNQASRQREHPESACSLVAKALAKVGHPMSENNVQKAWETYGVCRRR